LQKIKVARRRSS